MGRVRYPVAISIALALLWMNGARADVRISEHSSPVFILEAPSIEIPDPLALIGGDSPEAFLLLMPADGRVSSLFGPRRDPLGRGVGFHRGIDIANLANSVVAAAAHGVVEFAGSASGCGIAVRIDHGEGVETRSCHLSRALVREGQRVRAGDSIGLMGATGRATGSHLHFELLLDGSPVDPAPFVAF